MAIELIDRIISGSKQLYRNYTDQRFEIAESLENDIRRSLENDEYNPSLNLSMALIELGVFEELQGAIPYLDKLARTQYRNHSHLLHVYGLHRFEGLVPDSIRLSLIGLKFESMVLQSCRSYLEAVSNINKSSLTETVDNVLIETLLIESIKFHPSNFLAINYLYEFYMNDKSVISKNKIISIIKNAIAWRGSTNVKSTETNSMWLVDTVSFFTHTIIQVNDNYESDITYISKLNEMQYNIENRNK